MPINPALINYRTREYCLEVSTVREAANLLCDELKVRCEATGSYVAGSSVRLTTEPPVAYVRFRARDDEHAAELALQMSDADDRVLHTGYGAHRRIVGEA